MIPRLFDGKATTFESGGKGWLSDCITCKVKETLNGAYEASLTYPVDGLHFEDIQIGDYILLKPNEKDPEQLFSIYSISKPIDMQVDIDAEHVSYRLRYIPVEKFGASSAVGAMQKLTEKSVEENPFTFYTDIESTESFNVDKPQVIKTVLGGGNNSILSLYGGELKYDNFDVNLLQNRGVVTNRVLKYGVDITDFNQEERIDDTITGVCPYYFKDESVTMLPEKVLHSEYAENYPYPRTIPLDCSSQFDSRPSASALRSYALQYMEDNHIGIPEISIKVSYVDLSKIKGIDHVDGLAEIGMGDTISVEFEKLGISASAEITSYEYDPLKERYLSITVGTPKQGLAQMIRKQEQTDSTAVIQEAVAEANRYQKSGNKTVTLSNSDEAILFTMSDLDTMFELTSGTCDNTNTMVTASNADSTITTNVRGIGYSSGAWMVKFDSLVSGSVRVAYTVTYYGG